MPTTYTVMNANDSGSGSLRDAIDQSDANSVGAANVIDFDISGMQTIDLASPLPSITFPVLIDGTSQPGYSGTPLIELDGTNAGTGVTADGLVIASSGSSIRGLVVSGFGFFGIQVLSSDNSITSCYIGTDSTGTSAFANTSAGIAIYSTQNTIGGTSAGAGDVVSGNSAGILFESGKRQTSSSVTRSGPTRPAQTRSPMEMA